MNTSIHIATEQDAQIIASFQVKMAWETEAYKLDLETVSKGVEAVFQNKELGRYFVVKLNNEIIASLLTTYEWSDWRNCKVWWIQSVYVKPDYRRKGVFADLYSHIKRLAEHDENVGGIRLYVDKTNVNAQKSYNQVGMNGEHYQLFEWMKK